MKNAPNFDDIPIIYVLTVLAHFGMTLEQDGRGGLVVKPA